MAAGIPVVTWDADAPNSKRIAFYGVDDVKAGQIMGENGVKLLGGKGTVALMTSLGANNLQRRLDGVKEVLAKHPGIKVVETYRRQGGQRPRRGADRDRHESLSESRRLGLGRRLAGVHAKRARAGADDDAR